jgi:RNA polymerase sigma factor for flagellar operon FliA
LGGPLGDHPERPTAAELAPRDQDMPDRCCARQQLRDTLGQAMKTLPVRYQRVVTLYYNHGATMKQIGAELGVNESRVSQIHTAALEKLNVALRSRGVPNAALFVGV